MNIKIKVLFVLLLHFIVSRGVAQSLSVGDYKKAIKQINLDTIPVKDDEERILKNGILIKKLINILKTDHSFDFDLSALNHISVITSGDKKVKIFSWYLKMNDGKYRFYGCIQIATADGKLKLFPLIDNTMNLKDENEITTNKNWFGAKYYDIIPLSGVQKNVVYVLLGWKGNNDRTNKKVIDVLWFDKNEPMFGKNIFSQAGINNQKKRIIFEYNKENMMTLQLDKQLNTIVFDHLVPIDSTKKDFPEFYVSDGSFDGYKITGTELKFVENLILHNPSNGVSDDFENPKLKKPIIINQKTN